MNKLYKLYDTLPEPARFLWFLIIAMPGLILLTFEGISAIGFGYLLTLGLTRLYYLITKAKRARDAITDNMWGNGDGGGTS